MTESYFHLKILQHHNKVFYLFFLSLLAKFKKVSREDVDILHLSYGHSVLQCQYCSAFEHDLLSEELEETQSVSNEGIITNLIVRRSQIFTPSVTALVRKRLYESSACVLNDDPF